MLALVNIPCHQYDASLESVRSLLNSPGCTHGLSIIAMRIARRISRSARGRFDPSRGADLVWNFARSIRLDMRNAGTRKVSRVR